MESARSKGRKDFFIKCAALKPDAPAISVTLPQHQQKVGSEVIPDTLRRRLVRGPERDYLTSGFRFGNRLRPAQLVLPEARILPHHAGPEFAEFLIHAGQNLMLIKLFGIAGQMPSGCL